MQRNQQVCLATQKIKDTINTVEFDETIESQAKAKKQGGFTLIEIMIVVIAIGGLLAFLLPNLTSPSGRQDAQLMERVASSIYSNFEMLNMSCGTTRTVSSHPLEASAADGALLGTIDGEDPDDGNYQTCVDNANIGPISGLEVSGTDYTVNGKPVTVGNDGDSFTVQYTSVSSEASEILGNKRIGGETPDTSTAGTVVIKFRY